MVRDNGVDDAQVHGMVYHGVPRLALFHLMFVSGCQTQVVREDVVQGAAQVFVQGASSW